MAIDISIALLTRSGGLIEWHRWVVGNYWIIEWHCSVAWNYRIIEWHQSVLEIIGLLSDTCRWPEIFGLLSDTGCWPEIIRLLSDTGRWLEFIGNPLFWQSMIPLTPILWDTKADIGHTSSLWPRIFGLSWKLMHSWLSIFINSKFSLKFCLGRGNCKHKQSKRCQGHKFKRSPNNSYVSI